MLELVNITKDYYVDKQAYPALKGINLYFPKQQFCSILGPSGCGKTTTLNIIGGLDKYTTGDLIIEGQSTKNYHDYEWDNYRNKKIGFVFQSYNLISHLTILENVAMSLTLQGTKRKEKIQRAKAALDAVGLKDLYNKKPNQLSGGQQQRVAIARAIINDPEIILADEPTGALDSTTSVQIMKILKEISKNKLIIMVTHNRELALKYSDRIIEFKDGEVE
ncbi:MAG: ABC transporter ATP-binding protein, partial [bacterium]|nr:ABC transporter ATP-binding protein [bacterium]